MKHFEPSEINAQNCMSISNRELIETLRHYGFIIVGGGSHLKAKHREYKDLFELLKTEGLNGVFDPLYNEGNINISRHNNTAKPKVVKMAAAACLKVKELNSRRREDEHLSPLPDWLSGTLNTILKDDGTPKFDQREEHDVLRLFREPEGEARRSYRIICDKKGKNTSLQVTNLNFPDFCFSFRLIDGDRNPQGEFLRLFGNLDANVKAHIEAREHDYYRKLGELVANRGFIVNRDSFDDTDVPLLHLTHEGYGIEMDTLRIPPHETVADESIAMVEAALAESETRYFSDLERLETLKAQGWCVQVPNGNAYSDDTLVEIGRGTQVVMDEGEMLLTSPNGESTIRVPIRGALGAPIKPLSTYEQLISEIPTSDFPTFVIGERVPLTPRGPGAKRA